MSLVKHAANVSSSGWTLAYIRCGLGLEFGPGRAATTDKMNSFLVGRGKELNFFLVGGG